MWKEELEPEYDSCKSFYKKAHVIHYDDGSIALQSYSTIVAVIMNGTTIRTWGGYSNTTRRHVNDFFYQYGDKKLIGKKNWEKMPSYYENEWDCMDTEEREAAIQDAIRFAVDEDEEAFWKKAGVL